MATWKNNMTQNQWDVGINIDIGVNRTLQEDIAVFKELDDDSLLIVVSDGTESKEHCPQPASVVATDIIDGISSFFYDKKDLLLTDASYFLKLYMARANTILGAFKAANEEIYAGYAASATCLLLTRRMAQKKDGSKKMENMMYVAHAGNTRLYIIRNSTIRQLTTDHTVAAQLLAEGQISNENYYSDPRRLQLTSGLGLVSNPMIQGISGVVRDTDIFIMTTDGVHYAVNERALANLVTNSTSTANASKALVDAALSENYPDNMTAAVILNAKEFVKRQERSV